VAERDEVMEVDVTGDEASDITGQLSDDEVYDEHESA
jgi:hypothetical protein